MVNQNSAPLFEAVKAYLDADVVRFHVPGHKKGRGLPELREYLGDRVFGLDVNGMKDLDYINNPSGVIAQAQQLMAAAFKSRSAHFLVNGTTSGVQAMIMSACEPGNEIIISRNAHKSTIGGIILSGTLPVYIQPEINKDLGIPMNITLDSLRSAIKQHPHAKAVFLINPTYYGFTADLEAMVKLAHRHNMVVLVDEAHGAHMSFHEDFPISAMMAGADMSAASIHKTAGSLTQSSVLLVKSRLISPDKVNEVLGLSYTSSASYLLMCSLDVARKQLATRGRQMLQEGLELARQARRGINEIPGLYAFGRELVGTPGCFAFDETKLGINVRSLGYTGYQIEAKLRDEFGVQMELSDLYNTLAIVSLGDHSEDLERLVKALMVIAAHAEVKYLKNSTLVPQCPEMIVSPRDAFYSHKKVVPLAKSAGEVSGEMVMAYPPGIPVVCMGERISNDIVDYIQRLKSEECELQGTVDPRVDYIRVLGRKAASYKTV